MAIEFPCTDCGKQLRTPDDAAGKQARCPSCGEVNEVPLAAAGQPPVFERPAGDQPSGSPFETTDNVNPFATPKYSDDESLGRATMDSADRDGPAWERDGASMASFIETVKSVWGHTGHTFSTMRRRGGNGGPLMFALIGGTLGSVASALYGLVFMASIVSAFGIPNQQFQATPSSVAFQLVMAPIGVILGLYIGGAINHLCLMILGGANYGFDATFRVMAYSMGATQLLLVIPCVPQLTGLIAGIAYLVCVIVGFSRVHEISGWKATAAVFLPLIVCCGLGFIIAMGISGMAAIGGR